MASLVHWLMHSGARNSAGTPVASGRAWFYQPGTTGTLVGAFSDSDGLIALTQPVALDAGGKAEVYTVDIAQVLVEDSTGATVTNSDRSNSVTAAQVEIENDVATGVDPTNGQQREGGRTDLDTFLSSLRTSLGAPDGKVRIGAEDQLIKDVIGSSASVFFNVTSSSYGAAGDDSQDDTTPISNAYNAAVAAGGGFLLFPPGTYKLTSAVNINDNRVRLIAATPGAVFLKQYTAATTSLAITGNNVVVDGIYFQQGGAGAQAVSVSGSAVRFANCGFDVGTANASIAIGAVNTYFVACTFTNARTAVNLATVASGGQMEILGGTILMSGASTQVSGAGSLSVNGVELNSSAAAGANILTSVSGLASVTGCIMPATGGSTFVLIRASSLTLVESGCVFGTGCAITASTAGTGDAFISSQWRDHRILRTSNSATTYTPVPMLYQFHEVVTTGASFQWANPSGTPAGSGQTAFMVLRYKNTSGGAITPTFDTGYKATAVSVANNEACGWLMFLEPTLGKWVMIGSPVSYAS